MTEFIQVIKGTGIAGVAVRLFLAVLCGGLIGLERESKRRSAGFRTHTLICQYLLARGLYTDPTRLGAQVIAGMGFIGAGAIIVTSRRQVKGLTTAAGLWSSAIIGLAIGTGYYEAALIAVALVLFSEIILSKLEYFIISTARSMNIYVEFSEIDNLNAIVDEVKKHNMTIVDVEITKSRPSQGMRPSAILALQFKKKIPHENVMTFISEVPGVTSVEEL